MAMTRQYESDGTVVYKIEDAKLRRCTVCKAPMISPFPPTWSLSFSCDGPARDPRNQIWITPHVPSCAR